MTGSFLRQVGLLLWKDVRVELRAVRSATNEARCSSRAGSAAAGLRR